METTIKISFDVKNMLDRFKIHERETYNDVIALMIEDNLELNEQTKKDIQEARKEIKNKNFYTQEEAEKILGIK